MEEDLCQCQLCPLQWGHQSQPAVAAAWWPPVQCLCSPRPEILSPLILLCAVFLNVYLTIKDKRYITMSMSMFCLFIINGHQGQGPGKCRPRLQIALCCRVKILEVSWYMVEIQHDKCSPISIPAGHRSSNRFGWELKSRYLINKPAHSRHWVNMFGEYPTNV